MNERKNERTNERLRTYIERFNETPQTRWMC